MAAWGYPCKATRRQMVYSYTSRETIRRLTRNGCGILLMLQTRERLLSALSNVFAVSLRQFPEIIALLEAHYISRAGSFNRDPGTSEKNTKNYNTLQCVTLRYMSLHFVICRMKIFPIVFPHSIESALRVVV